MYLVMRMMDGGGGDGSDGILVMVTIVVFVEMEDGKDVEKFLRAVSVVLSFK